MQKVLDRQLMSRKSLFWLYAVTVLSVVMQYSPEVMQDYVYATVKPIANTIYTLLLLLSMLEISRRLVNLWRETFSIALAARNKAIEKGRSGFVLYVPQIFAYGSIAVVLAVMAGVFALLSVVFL